jgi:signal transduction histidine kinase
MVTETRILLVEDNPADSVLVRELLGEADPAIQMETLALLSEAEQRLAHGEPPVDAVLLDLSLPDSQGLETFRRINRHSPQTPIVVLTGLVDQTSAVEALRGGAQDYLIKGEIDASSLARSIRYAIERKQAEDEIRRLNAELERRVAERTARLESANRELESFAYSVSHDLRAPLRALDGFSQVLLEDYAEVLDEQGRGYLERIRAADARMSTLIDALLELSRLTRGELSRERLDLTAMAREAGAALAEAEPERQVELAVADGLAAEADAELARALLANLLGNAWKFTGNHDAARIEVGAAAVDGETAFFVRDDGAGFDMAYAEKLFGAFQRLHSPGQFEGLGIGLATVQRIVRRHGGRVWAEGEVDRGATFWFTLPDADTRG